MISEFFYEFSYDKLINWTHTMHSYTYHRHNRWEVTPFLQRKFFKRKTKLTILSNMHCISNMTSNVTITYSVCKWQKIRFEKYLPPHKWRTLWHCPVLLEFPFLEFCTVKFSEQQQNQQKAAGQSEYIRSTGLKINYEILLLRLRFIQMCNTCVTYYVRIDPRAEAV